jgi:hypothetical protein
MDRGDRLDSVVSQAPQRDTPRSSGAAPATRSVFGDDQAAVAGVGDADCRGRPTDRGHVMSEAATVEGTSKTTTTTQTVLTASLTQDAARSFWTWLYAQPPIAVFSTIMCIILTAVWIVLGVWIFPRQLDKITEGYDKLEASHVLERAKDRQEHRDHFDEMFARHEATNKATMDLIREFILDRKAKAAQ